MLKSKSLKAIKRSQGHKVGAALASARNNIQLSKTNEIINKRAQASSAPTISNII